MIKSLSQKTKIFLEMIKFEHSIFALPFAYLGLVLGERGWPRLPLFLLITLVMVSFRTFGMAVNRLVDLRIDALNPRTKSRALPAGKLKVPFVTAAALVSLAIYLWAVHEIGGLCFQLSWVPVVLTVLYPFLKRFTWLSHLVLGMILAIAPYGAWLASRQEFSWIAGFLSIGVMTWVCGFDIIYALQDMEFDRKEGLYSIPSRFSAEAALALTKILHAVTVICWLSAGFLANLGVLFNAGIVLVMGFLIREHWLIHRNGLSKIDEAFFTMNAFVSVAVFAAVVIDLAFGRYFL